MFYIKHSIRFVPLLLTPNLHTRLTFSRQLNARLIVTSVYVVTAVAKGKMSRRLCKQSP